jgi:hypothetical protein
MTASFRENAAIVEAFECFFATIAVPRLEVRALNSFAKTHDHGKQKDLARRMPNIQRRVTLP